MSRAEVANSQTRDPGQVRSSPIPRPPGLDRPRCRSPEFSLGVIPYIVVPFEKVWSSLARIQGHNLVRIFSTFALVILYLDFMFGRLVGQ